MCAVSRKNTHMVSPKSSFSVCGLEAGKHSDLRHILMTKSQNLQKNSAEELKKNCL